MPAAHFFAERPEEIGLNPEGVPLDDGAAGKVEEWMRENYPKARVWEADGWFE